MMCRPHHAACGRSLVDEEFFLMKTTSESPVAFEIWHDARGEKGFLHGTKAALAPGDLIEPGRASNFGDRESAAFVYLTETLDAATWGAELAIGGGPGRIYIVEPTGPIEDDPNLTDKKFPGNPTRSFRSRAPLKIVGEATDWVRQTPEELQKWREVLSKLKADSKAEIIN